MPINNVSSWKKFTLFGVNSNIGLHYNFNPGISWHIFVLQGEVDDGSAAVQPLKE